MAGAELTPRDQAGRAQLSGARRESALPTLPPPLDLRTYLELQESGESPCPTST